METSHGIHDYLEKRTGIYAKKIKLRRAKRCAENKRTKRSVHNQTTLPSPSHRNSTPPSFFGIRDKQDRYDDRYRIAFLQSQRPNNHFVPKWIILITSNYLHAGGWTSFIQDCDDRQSFYTLNSLHLDYFILFSKFFNLGSHVLSFNSFLFSASSVLG